MSKFPDLGLRPELVNGTRWPETKRRWSDKMNQAKKRTELCRRCSSGVLLGGGEISEGQTTARTSWKGKRMMVGGTVEEEGGLATIAKEEREENPQRQAARVGGRQEEDRKGVRAASLERLVELSKKRLEKLLNCDEQRPQH